MCRGEEPGVVVKRRVFCAVHEGSLVCVLALMFDTLVARPVCCRIVGRARPDVCLEGFLAAMNGDSSLAGERLAHEGDLFEFGRKRAAIG